MSLSFFEKILEELKPYTKQLALHVMGDPLTLSNLSSYLDLVYKNGFEVELTTSGYYLRKTPAVTLFHPCVRQINISLNSYNKNSLNLSFDEYMKGVLDLCALKLQNYEKPFINLRLWNLDEALSEQEFNEQLFAIFEDFFALTLDLEGVYEKKVKSIRLASKILLHFDNYFEWPSMQSEHSSQASCYGLRSHIGILVDGTVVPCCLDGDGIINLGNLHVSSLSEILESKRATAMREGFEKGVAIEELCQKCRYKDRFASLA